MPGPSAELFFPDELRGESQRLQESSPKAICQSCPGLIQCAEHAMRAPENYGVWGRMTAHERASPLGYNSYTSALATRPQTP